MPEHRRSSRTGLSLLACAGLLSACSSGGGDGEPAPGLINPTLSVSDASVVEGDSGTTRLQFTVSATAAAGNVATATVSYATAGGTATAGVDFEDASGTLTIPGGTSSVTLEVVIIGDADVEADETFTLTLSAPVNASIGRATATGTIRDDDATAANAGLDVRPDNQSCVAPARPTADAAVSIVDPFPSLPDFVQPTKLLAGPGGRNRWFVLQKTGQVMTFDPSAPAGATEFIDLTDSRSIRTNSEGGLLGMAFHPDYPATPELFLVYTIDHSGPAMRTVLSRLVLDDIDTPGGGTSEQIILEVDQDFDNHNGGDVAFGPDGYLYLGLGDGGSGNDPLQRAQDTTRLLGAMLRIDVIGTGAGYTIPPDNPFAGNPACGPAGNAAACPEIYAWGLRNPWRWSFDTASGQLWLADVGQNAWEEVNIIERGGNYGWRCREGAHDTINAGDCSGGNLVDPVTEYSHALGNSITGGYVYRGSAIPELVGNYVFADYGSGRFWVATPDGAGGYSNDELIDSNFNPTAFAIGPDGELYFVDISGSTGRGRVRRLEAPGSSTPDTIPDLLSATGCADPLDVQAPYAGLLPYELNAPFWSDGATKDRYIGLPNGSTIDIDADGDFVFPPGTVIVKNFRLGGRLVETRHLMRHPDGVWAGYTYEWNDAETEAVRVRGGKLRDVGGQTWIYPSEGECMGCHTGVAGFSLGPEIAQFNRDATYAATGRTANQLETLAHITMFSAPLPAPVAALDALADPADATATLDDRARAYLHTNCAQCHRPNGPTPSTMDLRYATPLSASNACNAAPLNGRLGIPDALLIAPGEADRSMLVERMRRRDVHGMPPLASALIDDAGVALIRDWINGLAGCS